MTLQALAPVTIRLNGQVVHYELGAVFTATAEQADRLLQRAPSKLRKITLPPDPVVVDGLIAPLQPGWLVAYRDQQVRLRGGYEERNQGTVRECQWDGTTWTVVLTNGDRLPLSRIVSVGQTDAQGRVVAAWTVRAHGYDGEGRKS